MKTDFGAAMRQALQLTREQNLMEATRSSNAPSPDLKPAPAADHPRANAQALSPPPKVSGTADAAAAVCPSSGGSAANAPRRPSGRARRPLGEVLRVLRKVELAGLRRGPAPAESCGKRRPSPRRRAQLARPKLRLGRRREGL